MTDQYSGPNLGGWDDVRAGLGEEWDFDTQGPLIGIFIGETSQLVDREIDGKPTKVDQPVYQFEPVDARFADTLGLVFVWGSYALDHAMHDPDAAIEIDDVVRLDYFGKIGIRGDKQQLRRYRVRVAHTADGKPITRAILTPELRAQLVGLAAPAVEPIPGERLQKAGKAG